MHKYGVDCDQTKNHMYTLPGFDTLCILLTSGYEQTKFGGRRNAKLSYAAQIEQTRQGCVDLETPNSFLVNTNLKDIINRESLERLPAEYQQRLMQLLPACDRVPLRGAEAPA